MAGVFYSILFAWKTFFLGYSIHMQNNTSMGLKAVKVFFFLVYFQNFHREGWELTNVVLKFKQKASFFTGAKRNNYCINKISWWRAAHSTQLINRTFKHGLVFPFLRNDKISSFVFHKSWTKLA